MECDFSEPLNVLKIITEIIGSENNIIINSNIYNHFFQCRYDDGIDLDDIGFDVKDDIYIIDGSNDKPINVCNVYDTFKKIQNQFKILKKKNLEATFVYEGIEYNKKKKYYEIYWGT